MRPLAAFSPVQVGPDKVVFDDGSRVLPTYMDGYFASNAPLDFRKGSKKLNSLVLTFKFGFWHIYKIYNNFLFLMSTFS